ncbi:hypothetical protein SAMN06265375_102361 [Muriicola jejuensis]|uniref:Lipocalin-like domain-containing protein n=1 Tax=Muriicola jejuensis TaxID=504488 RepID=A0A6P0UBJ9_9FLAO|nr:hypothetical protein [Muriicola jejuensis]NER10661.1 hypothetical protein [Muriicola jejuensis]SMP17104.1 hypothetical protein SAMN06265375_102361 [Muriicola jejuensis]
MKLNSIILLTVLSVLGWSCSKDSDNSEPELSQDQLEAISGLYNLSEYIVNPPQDLNRDDVYSADLMEELDCLSSTIILREDFTYSKYYEQLDITFITNDQYAISCGVYITENGTWDLINEQLQLSEEPDWEYSLDGSVLTLAVGKDLPDFRTQVYLKQ